MKNIFRMVFCANVKLEELSDLYGYDEDEVIKLLDHPEMMIDEEIRELENLIQEKIQLPF